MLITLSNFDLGGILFVFIGVITFLCMEGDRIKTPGPSKPLPAFPGLKGFKDVPHKNYWRPCKD